MVIADPIIARLALAIGIAMLMLGGVAAWTSANVIKRLVGVMCAMLGAFIALAALAAPPNLLMVGGAVLFAQIAVGGASAVRLQELYGGVEVVGLDVADDGDEPAERKT